GQGVPGAKKERLDRDARSANRRFGSPVFIYEELFFSSYGLGSARSLGILFGSGRNLLDSFSFANPSYAGHCSRQGWTFPNSGRNPILLKRKVFVWGGVRKILENAPEPL